MLTSCTDSLVRSSFELQESYARVRNLLKQNSSKLTLLAEALLLHEVCSPRCASCAECLPYFYAALFCACTPQTLSADECQAVVAGKKLPAPGAAAVPPTPSLWQRISGSGGSNAAASPAGSSSAPPAASGAPGVRASAAPDAAAAAKQEPAATATGSAEASAKPRRWN